jgi:formylglycine-generating enzyme required for sulfatase activity
LRTQWLTRRVLVAAGFGTGTVPFGTVYPQVFCWALAICLAICVAPRAVAQQASPAGNRIALVIGNGAYDTAPLPNAVRDSRVIGAALASIGFTVHEAADVDAITLRRRVEEFAREAHGADIVWVYYAGHGMQIDGENYLLPVRPVLTTAADVTARATSAQTLLKRLEGTRARTVVLVLDACRDNPFAATTSTGSGVLGKGGGLVSKGLARMDVTTGALVAFSAAPGATAADDGIYAKALSAQVLKPELELLTVFRNTTMQVRDATKGQQIPRISEVTLTDPVYLARPPEKPPGVATQTAAAIKDCDDCPELVAIPAGSFLMGSPHSEPGRDDDEGPPRAVAISRFMAGRSEVTAGQWQRCVQERGCPAGERDPKAWANPALPVVNVSWNDAQQYVQWLSRTTRRQYRLLSEAEWEYAARAGSAMPYSTGASITPLQARYRHSGSTADRPAPVCSHPTNAWGLCDMHGNVWEWVADHWHDTYTGAPADGAAWITGGDSKRPVMRGGAWNFGPEGLRSANRSRDRREAASTDVGFRVARDP